jgi:hypothetical protein
MTIGANAAEMDNEFLLPCFVQYPPPPSEAAKRKAAPKKKSGPFEPLFFCFYGQGCRRPS